MQVPLTKAVAVACFFFFSTSLATDVNYTIDDQLGDVTNGVTITYSPSGAWTSGDQCGCQVDPDASQIHDSTWTWTKYQPTNDSDDSFGGQVRSAEVTFNGSAVYVQAFLYNSKVSPRGNSDYTFYVDGRSQSAFKQTSANDSTYDYNLTVFSISGLANEQHTLRIDVGHLNETAIAMLDSIIYTQSIDDTTSSVNSQDSSKSNTGAIAGGVVGGLALLSAVFVSFIILRRRRARKGNSITPYSPNASSVEGLTSTPHLSNPAFANATPYIVIDTSHSAGSTSTDPRSSGTGTSFSGLQGAYGSTKMQKTPLTMDQIQPQLVPISTLSAIPPTTSIVAFAPTHAGPPTAAPPTDITSPLPTYSEANLAHGRPSLRVKP